MRITLPQDVWDTYRLHEEWTPHLSLTEHEKLWLPLSLNARLTSAKMSVPQVLSLLQPKAVPIFLLTRNPYVRLLSAFLDKIEVKHYIRHSHSFTGGTTNAANGMLKVMSDVLPRLSF